MTIYNYKCNLDDYIDYNFYLAAHDQSLQKRLLLFIVGFWAAVILLKVVYFPSPEALIVSIALCLVYSIVLPKIYWAIILKRISVETRKTTLQYPDIQMNIENNISVYEGIVRTTIEFHEITNVGWTKNSCFIFYKQNEKKKTLIIPLRCIDNLENLALALAKGA